MKKEELCKFRTAKILGMIVVGTFLVINLIWVINFLSYNKYMVHSPDEPSFFEVRTSYRSEGDGISYTVKKPDYLVSSGNIASDSADGNVSIIAWPSYFCCEIDSYGIMLYDENTEQGYAFYVDEEMNFHPKNYGRFEPEVSEAAKLLLSSMKEQVINQFQCMKAEFGF